MQVTKKRMDCVRHALKKDRLYRGSDHADRRCCASARCGQDTLMKKDDTGLFFEQRWVFANGNQGYYHFKIGHKPGDVDSFTKGWSKTSGMGEGDI